ncbi:dehydrogenase/reductase SDR family member 13 [Anolis carolinensis]|uniref:dehydrogenase/reductase SDR family member 13 n=1 Tax=Anolis carolinensis TaxID=28377 RepID=UPI002F2B748B
MESSGQVLLALGLLLGLYTLFYRTFIKGKECRNKTSLRGKTVLLTGGNSGIGKATALDLARRGARVIVASRNRKLGESAVSEIRKESGNNEVIFMSLDLGSLRSVRAFAEAFLQSELKLDILINNAAVICKGKSEDGFDVTFQVNHLGHFLLTHLLLDRIQQCSPSRVVIVSSDVHRRGTIDFQKVHKPVEGYLNAFQSYCNSKLANVLHVRELAKRLEGTGVTFYAVHPGAVHTNALRYSPAWVQYPYLVFTWLFFRDANNGAQTSIYCATEPGLESLSGSYFDNCRRADTGPLGRDDALATKLWEFSERLVGLSP